MALEAKLVQKLSQTLTMTPQLQQAIKLLQLGRLEYKEAIDRELLDNPVLEESPDEVPQDVEANNAGDKSEAKIDWEDYLESFQDYRASTTPKGSVDYEDKPQLENTIFRSESLCEYLLSQIRLLGITEEDLTIAAHIIGNLDKDGYLCSTFEEIAHESSCDVSEVERVISEIRTIEPAGLTARDLPECLILQLDHIGLGTGIEATIVRDHLEKVEKRRFDVIAKELKVQPERVYEAVTLIQNLEPRPGRQFAEDDVRYVVPDVYVQKVNGEYIITLNEDGLPKLRVSPYYLKVLQEQSADGASAKSYLHERLKAASWLIKSIHQRQQTIFKVTESIVKYQKDFLDHGIERLKPLVLRDIAQDIGMHESTVSRVTTNKYVHTPQGVYELKYFFTTGIKSAAGDMSSSSVKEKIRTLIAAENSAQPLSDQELVEILQRENIDIARRTVAKYRESLGISSSSKRKKIF